MSGYPAPPNHYLIFDGQNLADLGLHVSGAGTFGAPSRDVEEKEIPGRDGTLIIDNGRYDNIDIEYEGSVLAKSPLEYTRTIEKLRSFLSSRKGYKRLEDTYRMEEYRLASFIDGLDPDEILLQGSTFKLKFNCKPQRFLKDGEQKKVYTTSSSIYNPTFFNSKPLIRIYGSGSVTIDSITIKVTKPSTVDYVDIDSDMQDCYSGSLNCNDCVTITNNEFPEFEPGSNKITLNGVTKVEITPRWYTI